MALQSSYVVLKELINHSSALARLIVKPSHILGCSNRAKCLTTDGQASIVEYEKADVMQQELDIKKAINIFIFTIKTVNI